MKDRILYLDAIKALLMFFVIWGHVIQYTNVEEDIINPIASFIYSFHMPLFMAMSGFFFKNYSKRGIKNVIKSKSVQLLLPSVFILLLLFGMVFFHKPRSLQDSLSWLWNSRPWFTYSLFLCMIVSRICIRFTNNNSWMGFLMAFFLFCVIPDITDREIFMLPYFALGYYWNTINERSIRYENTALIISGASWMILYLAYFRWGGYDIYSQPLIIWSLKNGILANSNLTVAAIRFFTGLFGAIFMFLLLKKVFNSKLGAKLGSISFIQFVGSNTLGLYLFQVALFTIYMGLSNEIAHSLSYGRDYLPPLISAFLLLLLVFLIKVVRKSSLFALLLLGEYKK